MKQEHRKRSLEDTDTFGSFWSSAEESTHFQDSRYVGLILLALELRTSVDGMESLIQPLDPCCPSPSPLWEDQRQVFLESVLGSGRLESSDWTRGMLLTCLSCILLPTSLVPNSHNNSWKRFFRINLTPLRCFSLHLIVHSPYLDIKIAGSISPSLTYSGPEFVRSAQLGEFRSSCRGPPAGPSSEIT